MKSLPVGVLLTSPLRLSPQETRRPDGAWARTGGAAAHRPSSSVPYTATLWMRVAPTESAVRIVLQRAFMGYLLFCDERAARDPRLVGETMFGSSSRSPGGGPSQAWKPKEPV